MSAHDHPTLIKKGVGGVGGESQVNEWADLDLIDEVNTMYEEEADNSPGSTFSLVTDRLNESLIFFVMK